jgi:DNA polymerase V
LFSTSQPAEASRVMAVLDQINGRWGRGHFAWPVCRANPIGACAGR